MQMTAGLTNEIICLILIQGQRSIMDCIMNYIALGIIAEIDDLFEGLNQERSHALILSEPDDWFPVIINENIDFSDRQWWNKILFIYFWLLNFFYVCAYYYYFSFAAIIMNFLYSKSISCELMKEDPCPRNSY